MSQTWDVSEYARSGRFVADLADEVFSLLGPQAGQRVLDLGCGDGVLTERIRASGASVLGVDSSPAMVEAALARGLDIRLVGGESLDFDEEFDAVFSNAALHWMPDQEAVLAGVHAALKPGGRFVAEMGGHGNIAAIRAALRAVLSQIGVDSEGGERNVFPTAAEYGEMLRRSGFVVEQIALTPRPTSLPAGIEAWLRVFRRSLLESVPRERREEVVREVTELLRPILCDYSGQWTADYVRLRFVATKPEAV